MEKLMSSNKKANPLHPTFKVGGPNRADRRKDSHKSIEFKRVKRIVKEYTLRQHRTICVLSFMSQFKVLRKRNNDTISVRNMC